VGTLFNFAASRYLVFRMTHIRAEKAAAETETQAAATFR